VDRVTTLTSTTPADAYDRFYRDFDTPFMRQIRREAYGEDLGQHSWVTKAEVCADIERLGLSSSTRLVDLGCGPCGPLTFILDRVRCRGTGLERSPSALRIGQARAESLVVDALLSVREADLDEPLPLESASFDAAISVDVVLHVRDRLALFREVARLLAPGGRFLFTDAGVVTGSFSNQEVRDRSVYGYTQFVPVSLNERMLGAAGFRLIETEDRTASVIRNASGRLTAIEAHREELEERHGVDEVDRQRIYLRTVVELSRRGAVSRIMYLADVVDR
jgi:SAM-dependent methyltransferase